jgi:hypothetical protein
MRHYSVGSFAALLILSLVGCGSAGNSGGTFDNTGGAPPPGNAIAFVPVSFTLGVDVVCMADPRKPRVAVLARASAEIPVINGDDTCTTILRTALAGAFASLTADQAVGIYSLNLGGCVRAHEIAGVTRDGLVIRPWVLLHNISLCAAPAECDRAIAAIAAIRFDCSASRNRSVGIDTQKQRAYRYYSHLRLPAAPAILGSEGISHRFIQASISRGDFDVIAASADQSRRTQACTFAFCRDVRGRF